MKAVFLFALWITLFTSIKAQSKVDSLSLEAFTPKITQQNGANCYAYAGAYVALTIQVARSKNQIVDSATAFSFGFVDGLKDLLIKKYGLDSFNRLVSHDLYYDTASIVGNLDHVFYILKNYGTVSFSDFPYTTSKQIRKHFSCEMLLRKDFQKIVSINEVFKFNQLITSNTIAIFKKELIDGKPIICSIEQKEADCKWSDIVISKRTTNEMGNHVVTIIGFNKDSFLIKNNYSPECVTYYPIDSFFNILGWAYTYNIH